MAFCCSLRLVLENLVVNAAVENAAFAFRRCQPGQPSSSESKSPQLTCQFDCGCSLWKRCEARKVSMVARLSERLIIPTGAALARPTTKRINTKSSERFMVSCRGVLLRNSFAPWPHLAVLKARRAYRALTHLHFHPHDILSTLLDGSTLTVIVETSPQL